MAMVLLPVLIGIITFFVIWIIWGMFSDVLGDKAEVEKVEESPEHRLVSLVLPMARLFSGVVEPFFLPLDEDEDLQGYDPNRPFDLMEYIQRFTRGIQRSLHSLLLRAGKADMFTPLDIIGFMMFGGVVGILLGLVFYSEIDSLWLVVVFGGLGFFFPLLPLMDQAKNRQFEIRIRFPYVLDLLTLSVEAGLDFTAALQRIVDKEGKNALRDELARMLQQIQLGKSRSEALREFSERLNMEEARSVVSALIQADELGTPLGPILRAQAEQMRVKRAQRAEKLAQEAPVKMLLPLIGCIFPTVFIMLFGPIAIQVYQQFMK
ncbi:MAG: type II secretion system F family protein [Planctomycetota bacterium]|nr:MAG: type II secretion system F family protein [Planctomycetota bacterium]